MGRKGKVDNALTLLVKAKKLKRRKIRAGREASTGFRDLGKSQPAIGRQVDGRTLGLTGLAALPVRADL